MSRFILVLVLGVQSLCTVFFAVTIFDALFDFGIGPLDWQIIELIQIGAVIGLALGIIAGALLLRGAIRRGDHAEDRLRLASGAFAEVVLDKFDQWALTPAERDVALFVLKGFTTQEIAGLRETSEGTVKAQTNAIYRKSGVSGRAQLLSLFVDDLIAGGFSEENPHAPNLVFSENPQK